MLKLIVRSLRKGDYNTIVQSMRSFTNSRTLETPDEIWFVEHNPIYTLGQAGRFEHILDPGSIPIELTDRGGQVTYHGPGQLVIYPLLNLHRLNLGIRELISLLEEIVINVLKKYNIEGTVKKGAPGVYVKTAKIASIGLRIRRGCCYHGVSFNISMDLNPFLGINPCGINGLIITQLSDLGGPSDLHIVAKTFLGEFLKKLSYLIIYDDTNIKP